MELLSSLDDLHLCSLRSREKPLPSHNLPPITALLSRLQQQLICEADGASDTSFLISRVEQLFQTADASWLFSLAAANKGEDQKEGGWAELQAAYGSLVGALIGCAALPLCEDDCSSLPSEDYKTVPTQAIQVCSALRALLGTLGSWERGGGARGGLLQMVASQVCVFAVTHFQVRAWTSSSSREAAQNLQGALLRAGSWRDSAHLLMGEEGEGRKSKGILGGILDVLQPQLTK